MKIIPFEEKYNQAVIDLIMAIQQDEFDLPISIEEQPDLLNIRASYQDKKGEFWIALDDKKRVVGCIGLVSLSDSNVALKKMFVASNCRG
ncbi:MAG: GNAT family N-acetyltransferase, partial [Streptococcus orisratti]|uniref:GNAT family N-acetyltransferase n=1 Tax=Streptococcus orisratti TaxID=114652 RepID=UPI002A91BEE3